MKKIAVFLVAVLVLLTFSACAKDKPTGVPDVSADGEVIVTDNIEPETTQKAKKQPSGKKATNLEGIEFTARQYKDWDETYKDYKWNDLQSTVAQNGKGENQVEFHITFPPNGARSGFSGYVGRFRDNTAGFLGMSGYDDICCDSAEEVIDAYSEKILDLADTLINESTSRDISYEIADKEHTEVSGHDAYRYEGTFKYTTNDGSFSRFFAGYTVQLAEDVYIWWFLADETDNGSAKENVIYDVDTMALMYRDGWYDAPIGFGY